MTNQCKHGVPAFGYCKLCCREMMTARSLIEAANFMVLQHGIFETMSPAVEAVSKQFPKIPEPLLAALWIGINAKHRDIEIES